MIEIPDFSFLTSNVEYQDLYDHDKITNAMQTNVSLVMQEAAKVIFHTIVFNRTVGVHQPQQS